MSYKPSVGVDVQAVKQMHHKLFVYVMFTKINIWHGNMSQHELLMMDSGIGKRLAMRSAVTILISAPAMI